MKVKVFDFFSGCGGTSCGFREAGMDIRYALDKDVDAQASFEANFPDAHLERKDIRELSVDGLRSRVQAEAPCPVLFCGCAPCQPFSKQITHRPSMDDDDRVPLLSQFMSLVEACRPDIVFVENVPGLQKLCDASQPFGDFLLRMKSLGYDVTTEVLMLAKFGVPQRRRRLVVIGSRHGKIALPEETHGSGTPNGTYSTVHDWIADFPPIQAGETHGTIANHRAAKLSARNLERIRATPQGGGNRDWPDHLKLQCHAGFIGYSDAYGRMSWDAPASGLTTRCTSYSNGRFGHPEQDRAISVREAACLQTFPLHFRFKGSMASMSKQIGNAVPVRLAELIGKQVLGHLEDARVLV